MFYGKYEDDGPSLAQQVAKVLSKKNDDDEVRLTARYCNSGDYDGPQDSSPEVKSEKSNKDSVLSKEIDKSNSVSFDNAEVGDTIKGLESLGKVVSISGPNDPLPKPKTISDKKIQKGIKWLERKGFDHDGEEYKGQHSYWNERMQLSVVTDPKYFILNWNDSISEDEELFTSLKSLKVRVKEIMAIYR